MIFIKALSCLPLSILYVLADLIFFLGYYITGYRRNLVFGNLRKAFPDKSNREIKTIARKFYRHLADIIVETIHGLTISEKELLKRIYVKNIEYLNQYYENGKSVIIMSSHHSNWEWLTQITSLQVKAEANGVYQQLKNPFFDHLMMKIRMRFDARLIEKKAILKDLIMRKDVLKIVGMISDQSPVIKENRFWTTFLSQETAFFTSSEKIAKKLNMGVVYAKMDKIRRGYYEVEYIPIDAPPFNPEPEYITLRFIKLLENHINEAPAYWLWSHNRWKIERE
ncbi:lysophospholipid acyltransferase family protein [Bacteroidota bacterium]